MRNPVSWPLVGGVMAALGTGACCVGPLILVLLGVGGSWGSILTGLAPYRPLFVILTVVAFYFAWLRLVKVDNACENDEVCVTHSQRRRQKQLYWAAFSVSAVFVLSPYWIPLFY
ncbi:mercuric transporter MerT family protein [Parasalinivibrio latis]|uniref:mercuric transporter MerT family protein n=1 Tax=Parasalinivibrio latis TaxID=2952610 RepID=UPI0030E22C9F